MASERTKAARRARAQMKALKRSVKRSRTAPISRVAPPPAQEPIPTRDTIEDPVALPEEPPVETVDYSSMTKTQLQDLLKERGVAYLPQSTKRILIGLLENV